MNGIITDIQRFCVHDGPGIRTSVFFKGCPLRCRWCHNPETNSNKAQLRYINNMCVLCGACAAVCPLHKINGGAHVFNSAACKACFKCADVCRYGALTVWGRTVSAEEVLDSALADKPFYGSTGGITLTGGEPCMQPDFCIELLRLCKENGLNTCIETSGCFEKGFIKRIAPYTDHVLLDIKDGNAKRLKSNTGQNLSGLLANLHDLDKSGVDYCVRSIIIGGINDTPQDVMLLKKIKKPLRHCNGWTLFSYHALGNSKREQLGISPDCGGPYAPVDAQKIAELQDQLNC